MKRENECGPGSARARYWFWRHLRSLAPPVLAILLASAAQAQGRMSTVVQQGENGIRIGAGRLHPLLGFETRYDSFVAQSSKTQLPGQGPPQGAGDLILQVRPGLEFKLPSDTLELGARLVVDYNAYTGMDERFTRDLSQTAASLDLGALLNPRGRVKVGFEERYDRSDRITNLELGALTLSNRNEAGIHLDIAPGNGSLRLLPAYLSTYEHFEARPGNPDLGVSRNDYWQHMATLAAVYELRSEAVLSFDSSVAIRSYERAGSKAFDSTNLRLRAGYAGMVMQRISILAKAGYGKQLQEGGYKGLLGQAELGYLYSELTEVRAGYLRSYEPSPSAGFYYADDRLYLDGRTRLGPKLHLTAGFSLDRIFFADSSSRGTEDQLGFQLGPDWEFNPFLTAGLSYTLTTRASSQGVAGLEYDRHEVGAHVLVYY